MLAETGMVTDPTKIWWDLRPSAKHPDARDPHLRHLHLGRGRADDRRPLPVDPSVPYHLKANNQRWRHYRRILILENKWRAQRYGVEAEMADFGKRVLVPLPALIDELVELLRPHAAALGCVAEIEHARAMARRGSSADQQLQVYRDALDGGASDQEAQVAVVDWLVEQSVATDCPRA